MVAALALADDDDPVTLGGRKLGIIGRAFTLDGIGIFCVFITIFVGFIGLFGRFLGGCDWCALIDDSPSLWYDEGIHLSDLLDGHAIETNLQELVELVFDVGAINLWLSGGTEMVEAIAVETEEHVCALDDILVAVVLGIEPRLYQFGELMIHI